MRLYSSSQGEEEASHPGRGIARRSIQGHWQASVTGRETRTDPPSSQGTALGFPPISTARPSGKSFNTFTRERSESSDGGSSDPPPSPPPPPHTLNTSQSMHTTVQTTVNTWGGPSSGFLSYCCHVPRASAVSVHQQYWADWPRIGHPCHCSPAASTFS